MESSVQFAQAKSRDEKDLLFKRVLDNLLGGIYFTDRERRITY